MKNGINYNPIIGESYSRLVCRSPKAKTLARIQVPLLLVVSRTTQWMDIDASRVTTVRGFTPMLGKRATTQEGGTLWGYSLLVE